MKTNALAIFAIGLILLCGVSFAASHEEWAAASGDSGAHSAWGNETAPEGTPHGGFGAGEGDVAPPPENFTENASMPSAGEHGGTQAYSKKGMHEGVPAINGFMEWMNGSNNGMGLNERQREETWKRINESNETQLRNGKILEGWENKDEVFGKMVSELRSDKPRVEVIDTLLANLSADEADNEDENFGETVRELREWWETQRENQTRREREEFANFTNETMRGHPEIEKLEAENDTLKMEYKRNASFLGIFPVEYTAEVEANESGLVKAETPWWLFLAGGDGGFGEKLDEGISHLPDYELPTKMERKEKIAELMAETLEE